MQTIYANTTHHARALTRGTIAASVAAYLATGNVIRVYPTGAQALPYGAIANAMHTGRKPSIHCLHNPIATHAIA